MNIDSKAKDLVNIANMLRQKRNNRCINLDSGYKMIARRRVLQSTESRRCQCRSCKKRGSWHYYRARHSGLTEGWYCLECVRNKYGFNLVQTGIRAVELWQMPELVNLPLKEVIEGGRLDV